MESVIEKLAQKIDNLVQKYETLKEENETLRRELVTCKAASEAKDADITRLQDELALKEMELEEIVKKIEKVLG